MNTKQGPTEQEPEEERVCLATSQTAAKVTLVTDFGFLSLLTAAQSCFVVWPACFKDSTQTHARVSCYFCHPKG